MKAVFKSKVCLIITICIILGLFFYGFSSLKKSNPLTVSLVHMEFSSTNDNLKNKNINYKVFVKNNSDKQISYQLVFTRNDSSNYTYLDSIPKEYKSEILTIQKNKSEYLELKSIYSSNQDSNTGGFYDNFKVTVQYK